MSEEIKQETKEEQVRLRVKRHLWQDEDENKELKKINKRLTILVVLFTAVSLLLSGVLIAYINRKDVLPTTLINDEKYNEAMSIMSEQWFFSNQIDNVKERLQDQALSGMTTNEEDPHTSYMSREEGEEFVTSINRNFVGIGVQYQSTMEGYHLITRVFKNSPAEKAGVQPGDYIYAVDGTITKDLSSDNVVELVRGEEGTTVRVDVMRNGEVIPINIVRGQINASAFGEIVDGVGLLEIIQFGSSTAEDCRGYLQDFMDAGVDKLVIDLRGDGGGYLYALQDIAGLFLPSGSVAIVEEDNKGNKEELYVKGSPVWKGPVVLLMDEDTASAAEAFVLAMKEQYPNVKTLGTQTYGKGTVQITFPFSDGSSLKYTTSKWISKSGMWINEVGITPDEVVELHPAINYGYMNMEDGIVYEVDSVDGIVKSAQLGLDYLEYEVDRTDGYFSTQTESAVRKFQEEKGLEVTGKIDKVTYSSLVSAIFLDWNTNRSHDAQLQRALEILNG
ncbi:MAG: S41 family peptidase [Solobacterium sp.]|nr:S41 family peptidase [Solobacterium sp.]